MDKIIWLGAVFLAINLFIVRVFRKYIRHLEVDDQEFDQKSEKPSVPPFESGDKVEFMNGGDKLTKGTVLEVRDHESDPGHQRVTIKYWEDLVSPSKVLGETTVSSRKVILALRPQKD